MNCQKLLAQVAKNFPVYESAGVRVFAVAAQDAHNMALWLKKNPLPFDFLSDLGRGTIKAYGVHIFLSWDSFRVARPSAFLINKEGRVNFIYRSTNQWNLPTDEVMLDALKGM